MLQKLFFLRTTYLLDMEKLYTTVIVAEQLKFYSTEKQLLLHTNIQPELYWVDGSSELLF